MYKNSYEVNVLVNGKPVREYYHNDKFFIEAKDGTEYSIKLKNHGHKKIMAVISVDGVDVLKGGNAKDAQSGYVINPYSSTNIKGYRINDGSVANFKFSDGKKSYATQVEQDFNQENIEKVESGEFAAAKNNGVIGVRIWEEESEVIPNWKSEPYNNKSFFYGNNSISSFEHPIGVFRGYSSQTGCFFGFSGSGQGIYLSGCYNPAPGSGVSMSQDYTGSSSHLVKTNYTPEFNLGTDWGKQVDDKAIRTEFKKSSKAAIEFEMFYLTRSEMEKMGIDFGKEKKMFISGFPSAFGDDKYCKKPLGWKGDE